MKDKQTRPAERSVRDEAVHCYRCRNSEEKLVLHADSMDGQQMSLNMTSQSGTKADGEQAVRAMQAGKRAAAAVAAATTRASSPPRNDFASSKATETKADGFNTSARPGSQAKAGTTHIPVSADLDMALIFSLLFLSTRLPACLPSRGPGLIDTFLTLDASPQLPSSSGPPTRRYGSDPSVVRLQGLASPGSRPHGGDSIEGKEDSHATLEEAASGEPDPARQVR